MESRFFVSLTDDPQKYGRTVYLFSFEKDKICITTAGSNSESICLSAEEIDKLYLLLKEQKEKASANNSLQDIINNDPARIRDELEKRLIGTIREPEHDSDLLCWCKKKIQHVEKADFDIVAHCTVDEFIQDAFNEVFGTKKKRS